jgi:hypothetical protein
MGSVLDEWIDRFAADTARGPQVPPDGFLRVSTRKELASDFRMRDTDWHRIPSGELEAVTLINPDELDRGTARDLEVRRGVASFSRPAYSADRHASAPATIPQGSGSWAPDPATLFRFSRCRALAPATLFRGSRWRAPAPATLFRASWCRAPDPATLFRGSRCWAPAPATILRGCSVERLARLQVSGARAVVRLPRSECARVDARVKPACRRRS